MIIFLLSKTLEQRLPLGGKRCSAREFHVQPASQEACASLRGKRIDRTLALLEEALEIIDSMDEFPELGAKLNHVTEELREKGTGQ